MTVEEMKIKYTPKPVIKEELGGGFFYRCPWISCNSIVRSEDNYCRVCGQRLEFPFSDYENKVAY